MPTRGEKLHGETHKWLADTVHSFSHPPCASKAGVETIHMLWMSLLTVQLPILYTERGYPKLAFYEYFESQPSWNISSSVRPTSV